ncbi:hypothetical protein [Aquabacterium sp.]|uniref:hypothetical protein n=1 Tax=Aquabacterium sp. TaxID=1872578 RepID=UPI0037834421
MALIVDDSSANMSFSAAGAKAAVHLGTHFAVVHCSAGANLGAGNSTPAGKVKNTDAIQIKGTVFVEATGNEFDLGDREFGMVQVTELYDYQFQYAGRLASDGSALLNVLAGFTKNPSLDVQPASGESTDEHIFSFMNLDVKRVTTPRTGFEVTVLFGDHPNNVVPLRYDNQTSHSPNFLARIRRVQHFVVYFLTRGSATETPRILGRLGWAVTWDCDVNWTIATMRPKLTMKRAELFPGSFKLGPPPASDNWAQIAVNRSGPATNAQDTAAVDRIYSTHAPPVCQESPSPPDGFRSNFFS